MENLKLELKALAELCSKEITNLKVNKDSNQTIIREIKSRLLDTITELESGRVFESELIWE